MQSWSAHVGGSLAFVFGVATFFFIIGNRASFGVAEGGLALTYAVVAPYFINIISEMCLADSRAWACHGASLYASLG